MQKVFLFINDYSVLHVDRHICFVYARCLILNVLHVLQTLIKFAIRKVGGKNPFLKDGGEKIVNWPTTEYHIIKRPQCFPFIIFLDVVRRQICLRFCNHMSLCIPREMQLARQELLMCGNLSRPEGRSCGLVSWWLVGWWLVGWLAGWLVGPEERVG